ncbi:MAG: DUF222 domain-containing protein [Actinobacteria bacterium]|nr:DUF222 domain-containing protein [Actinomycetota bacterium]
MSTTTVTTVTTATTSPREVVAPFASLADDFARLVDELDPKGLIGSEATGLLGVAVRLKKAAGALEVLVAKQAVAAGEWRRSGARCPEEWLARKEGTSFGQAKGTLAGAAAIDKVPQVAEALQRGQVSPDQAAVIAGAAVEDPSATGSLLEAAQVDDLRGLRRKAARIRQGAVKDEAAQHAAQQRARRVDWAVHDEDGMLHLSGALTPAQGARFRAVIQPYITAVFRDAKGTDVTAEQKLADGFMRMVEAAADPSKRLGTGGCKVIVRVDAAALARGHSHPGEICEITGQGPVSVPVVDALLPDAYVAFVVTNGVDVTHVAHAGRFPTTLQRTALQWRDPACTVEGCSCELTLETDHLVGYAQGGATQLFNLGNKCAPHHWRKTTQGYRDGPRRPDGQRPLLPPGTGGARAAEPDLRRDPGRDPP